MSYIEHFDLHLSVHLTNQCCPFTSLEAKVSAAKQDQDTKIMPHKGLLFLKHCTMLFTSPFLFSSQRIQTRKSWALTI